MTLSRHILVAQWVVRQCTLRVRVKRIPPTNLVKHERDSSRQTREYFSVVEIDAISNSLVLHALIMLQPFMKHVFYDDLCY